MKTPSMKVPAKRFVKQLLAAGIALITTLVPQIAGAVSTWNPTLLVNTESFQSIDDGDGSTDIELRFGGSLNEKLIWNRAKSSFQFTDDLSVQGVMSGSALRVDGNADVWGNLTASGTLQVDGAANFGSTVNATGNITTKANLSGSKLRVSGAADIHGPLSVSGAVRTDDDLTINDDRGAVDATLTFGNQTANQTLKYLHATQRFQFSKDISVVGNISGSTLNIDRTANIRGALSVSGALMLEGHLTGATIGGFGLTECTGANSLRWNAATGKFECAPDDTGTIGDGSGGILSLHPEYPNAVYFGSGTTYIGQLTASGSSGVLDNVYHWTSTKADMQDYWIAIRVRLPDNFSSWDPMKPIELRYRTGVATNANNHLTVRIKDTAGASVALTGGAALASTSFATAAITGPQAGGTWTPKGYITVYVKLASDNTGFADAGFLNLNFETTVP